MPSEPIRFSTLSIRSLITTMEIVNPSRLRLRCSAVSSGTPRRYTGRLSPTPISPWNWPVVIRILPLEVVAPEVLDRSSPSRLFATESRSIP